VTRGRTSLGWGLLVCLLAGVGWWWFSPGAEDAPRPIAQRFRLVAVERGSLEQVVTANGTLNPVTLVNVGTQVSGTIRAVRVDFNEPVRAGQVLAEIDPALIEAQIAQLEANLAESQSQLRLAERRLARNEELVARGFIASAQRDDERQSLEAAQARIRAITAQLDRERTNLGYTVIRSPIDGVVIARSVDVGQTVAASFQTPQLFLIARDLRDMQIDVNVAEADVGALRVGMTARFRVDALGEREFDAKVRQIRLNPKIEQTVVTYNVVLSTRNDDGRLLPGMTAAVRVRVAAKEDVLRVPNTALRFRPGDPEVVVAAEPAGGRAPDGPRSTAGSAPDSGASQGRASPSPPPEGAKQAWGGPALASEQRRGFVHVESRQGDRPVLLRVPVLLGITDGTHTEVFEAAAGEPAGALRPGDRIAVGEIVQPATGAQKAGGFRLRLF
jgi:HlyD family secretion protein